MQQQQVLQKALIAVLEVIRVPLSITGMSIQEALKVRAVCLHRDLACAGSDAGNQVDVIEDVGVVHPAFPSAPHRVDSPSPAERVGKSYGACLVALSGISGIHHRTTEDGQAHNGGN